jgi:hypothetical protein
MELHGREMLRAGHRHAMFAQPQRSPPKDLARSPTASPPGGSIALGTRPAAWAVRQARQVKAVRLPSPSRLYATLTFRVTRIQSVVGRVDRRFSPARPVDGHLDSGHRATPGRAAGKVAERLVRSLPIPAGVRAACSGSSARVRRARQTVHHLAPDHPGEQERGGSADLGNVTSPSEPPTTSAVRPPPVSVATEMIARHRLAVYLPRRT